MSMLKFHCSVHAYTTYIDVCVYIYVLKYKKEIEFYRSFISNDHKISLSLL